MRIVLPSIAALLFLASCGGSGGGTSAAPVTPVSSNTAPVVASPNANQTGQVGVAFTYDASQNGATFTDANGDALNIGVTFAPSDRGFTANGAAISGTPNDLGAVTVTVTASDGSLGITDTFTITVGADQDAVQTAFGGRIDLENLTNYANPSVPGYIRPAAAVANPVTDKGAALGRVIFYDRQLSVNGFVACGTCHRQSTGFSEPGVTSQGVFGLQTGRHSMRLVNTLYTGEPRFFWDERAVDIEDQVTRPMKDENEHGFSGQNGRPDFDDLIAIMAGNDYYRELFQFVFLDDTITEARIQSALGQFVNSIVSFDSKFDEGRAQAANNNAPFPNFTAAENSGKALFMGNPGNNGGGAGCARCHGGPEFAINDNSNQNGVVGVAADPAAFDFTNTRAPALRDLVRNDGASNGPFMHDGSLADLRSVIDHYDNIPVPPAGPNRTQFLNTLDNRLMVGGVPRQLNLSETEKNELEAFLRTLSGTNLYTDAKWSDPF